MTVQIDSTARIVRVRLQEQGSDPAAPTAGYWYLYAKSNGLYVEDDASNITGPFIDAASLPHNLLSATHSDTLAGSVADGSLIIGNATPKWSRLAISIPAANVRNVLGVDNGELRPSWKTALDATNPTTIGIGDAAAPGTSLIFAHRDHQHASPATWTSTPHSLLSATHGDTTPAAVTRGALITGQGVTPTWSLLAAGSQYQVLTMGVDEPAWGAVNLAQAVAVTGVLPSANGGTGVDNGGRTITINSNNAAFTFSGAYTLTIPATGTVALLQVANTFTQIQSITDTSYVSGFQLNTQGAPGGFFTDYATFSGTRDDRIWMTYNFVPVGGIMARSDGTKPATYFLLEGDYNNGATHVTEFNYDYYGADGTYRRWQHQETNISTHAGEWRWWAGDGTGTGDVVLDSYKDFLIGGIAGTGNVRFVVRDATNDSTKYVIQLKNSDATELYSQKNDGTTTITGLASVVGQEVLNIHNSTGSYRWVFVNNGAPTASILLKGYDSTGAINVLFSTQSGVPTYIVPVFLTGRTTDTTNAQLQVQQNGNNPFQEWYTAGGQLQAKIYTVGAADASKRAVLDLNNVTTTTIRMHGNGTSFLNGGSVAIGQTSAAAKLDILGTADVQQLLVTGFTTQANATAFVQFTRNNAAAGIQAMLGLTALGSGANGDGGSIVMSGKSSTTAATLMAMLSWEWINATHASRTARGRLAAYDTASREGFSWGASGTAPTISFYGGTLVARATALTTQLTTITYTAPGTPDYALQDVTQTTPWGFADAEEARTFISVVKNLQDRVAEIDARLNASTGVNLWA